MQLSRKRKITFVFFFPFSNFKLNFEHFQKKDDPPSSYIFELRDFKKGV